MNNSKLSYGLNLTKKPGPSKPNTTKRKPIFGVDDDSDEDVQQNTTQAQEITELDGFGSSGSSSAFRNKKSAKGLPSRPPQSKAKGQNPQFGDLSSALTSRKYAEDAEKLDPSIYDYDASHDSFKAPKKGTTSEEGSKRKGSQYMSNVKRMAEVRERDRRIAEDKKMQREREEEGDEFADKEKFVTEAYKRQQEENKRMEAEERRREEDEARKNKSGGMTGFYKNLLAKEEERHSEIMKAAEDLQKNGPVKGQGAGEEDRVKTDAELAREINEKGGSVALNEDGQVVDKRQLLKGGLNVGAKKKAEAHREA